MGVNTMESKIALKARENPDQFAKIGMNKHQKGEKQDEK
jgi:hypothetical protein